MKTRLVPLLLVAALAGVVTAAPAGAAEAPPIPAFARTACPQLTDSLHRLYTAYFLRSPEQGGFEYWEDEYSEGRRNLDNISGFFAVSPEFQATYGSLDNDDFVDLVYRNVMDRAPDAAGREYWLSQLNAGMPRGTMMIFFSESEEYVLRTATAPPLAGYLRWYPDGVRFACGWGDVRITPTDTSNLFDLVIHNDALSASFATVSLYPVGSGPRNRLTRNLEIDQRLLLASEPLNASGVGYSSIEIDVAADAYWAFVEFPRAIPRQRPGW